MVRKIGNYNCHFIIKAQPPPRKCPCWLSFCSFITLNSTQKSLLHLLKIKDKLRSELNSCFHHHPHQLHKRRLVLTQSASWAPSYYMWVTEEPSHCKRKNNSGESCDSGRSSQIKQPERAVMGLWRNTCLVLCVSSILSRLENGTPFFYSHICTKMLRDHWPVRRSMETPRCFPHILLPTLTVHLHATKMESTYIL